MTDWHIERVAQVTALYSGAHAANGAEMCAMEAVAFVAGEPWSDHPQCACPVIGAFMRAWNDGLPDADRTRLLLPLVPKLVGTRSTPEVESARAWMAVDWLTRTQTVAWLRLAKLDTHADAVAALPELTATTWDACKATVAAARAAAWAAARAAAGAAAGAAARDAARDAARAAAGATAGDPARVAAGAAAGAAAGDAARALTPTVAMLQESAVKLVERMIEVKA